MMKWVRYGVFGAIGAAGTVAMLTALHTLDGLHEKYAEEARITRIRIYKHLGLEPQQGMGLLVFLLHNAGSRACFCYSDCFMQSLAIPPTLSLSSPPSFYCLFFLPLTDDVERHEAYLGKVLSEKKS